MMISSSHPLSFVAMFHHYDEVVVVGVLVLVVALCRHRRRGDDVASVSVCVCTPCVRSPSRGVHTRTSTHALWRRNTKRARHGVDVEPGVMGDDAAAAAREGEGEGDDDIEDVDDVRRDAPATTTTTGTNAAADDDDDGVDDDDDDRAVNASKARVMSRSEMLERLTRELEETETLIGRHESHGKARGGGAKVTTSESGAWSYGTEASKGRHHSDGREMFASVKTGATAIPSSSSMKAPLIMKTATGVSSTRIKMRGILVVAACACVAFLSLSAENSGQRARRMIHQSSLSAMACEEAFAPARVGTWPGISQQVTNIVAATDHVYILGVEDCFSENVTMRVPSQWAGKATCVNGKVLDKCTSDHTGVYFSSHYTRVSVSHGMIIKVAKEAGHKHVTVMEADATFDTNEELQAQTVTDATHLISGPTTAQLGRIKLGAASESHWNIIRLGFRPHLFEQYEVRKAANGGGYVEVTTGLLSDARCPEQCKCTEIRKDGQLCMLSSSGCDLRSSEMYIASERAYDELLGSLFDGTDETIIDHFVLQNIEHSWVMHPSRTVQKDLDIPVSLQKAVQSMFEERCLI